MSVAAQDGNPSTAKAAAAPSSVTQLDLSSFLRTINAEVSVPSRESSSSTGSSDKSSAGSPPSLPISARVALLDAQISTVSDLTAKAIQADLPTFRSQAEAVTGMRAQMDAFNMGIGELEAKLLGAGSDKLLSSTLPSSLSDYHSALSTETYESALLDAMLILEHSTKALMAVETLARQGSLDESQFKVALQAARKANAQGHARSPSSDASCNARLAQLPYVRAIESRLETVEKKREAMLDEAWTQAFQIRAESDSISALSLSQGSIHIQKSVRFTPDSPDQSNLATIFSLLDSRSTLSPRLHSLALEMLKCFCDPILSRHATDACWRVSQTSDGQRASYSIEYVAQEDDDPWNDDTAQPPSNETALTGTAVVSTLLQFVSTHLFAGRAPPRAYSNALLPQLLRLIMTHLTKSVSSTLSSLAPTLSSVNELCTSARELHAVLVRIKMASEDDSDEDDVGPAALLRWAASGTSHLARSVSDAYRDSARLIILDDASGIAEGGRGGWAGEVVEMETEVDIPSLPKVASEVQPAPVEPSGRLSGLSKELRQSSAFSFNTASSQEDDEFVDAMLGSASPRNSPSPAPSRSTSSHALKAPSQQPDGPTARKARGRAALGAARVIRPQDQMGSGPWDEDDATDPVASVSRSASMGPTAQTFAHFIPEDDEDDDDAWGLSTEEVEARAAKRASKLWGASDSVAIPPPAPIAEDDDVAWDLDAPSSIHPEQAATFATPSADVLAHLVPAPGGADDDEEDDAWGLSTDEVHARADRRASKVSNTSAIPSPPVREQDEVVWDLNDGPGSVAPTSARLQEAPTHSSAEAPAHLAPQLIDDDEDDDAWGLSLEQKEDLAAKRASRLIDSSSTQPSTDRPTTSSAMPEVDEDARGSLKNVTPAQELAHSPPVPADVVSANITREEDSQGSALPATFPVSLSPAMANKPAPTITLAEEDNDAQPVVAAGPPAVADGSENKIAESQSDVSTDEQEISDAAVVTHETPAVSSEFGAGTSLDAGAPSTSASSPSQEAVPYSSQLQPGARGNVAAAEGLVAASVSDHDQSVPSRLRAEHDSIFEERTVESSAPAGEPVSVTRESPATPISATLQDKADGDTQQRDVAGEQDALKFAQAVQAKKNATEPHLEASNPIDEDEDEDWPDLDVNQETSSAFTNSANPDAIRSVPSQGINGQQQLLIDGQDGDAWGWQDDLDEDENTTREPFPPRTTNGVPTNATATPLGGPARQTTADSSTGVASSSRPSSRASQQAASSSVPRNSPRPSPPKEKCTISKRSKLLIEQAQRMIGDAVQLSRHADAESSDAVIAPDPHLLLDTLLDAFDLHRALMPVAHAEILANVPALSMQFANDCSYIARELLRLEKAHRSVAFPPRRDAKKDSTRTSAVDQDGHLSLAEQAKLTTALGRRWFEMQLGSQTQVLMDILDGADGFEATYEDGRLLNCQRAIKQVIHTLTQLAKVWEPPLLAPWTYMAALGRLVERVLQRIVGDITALDDISEVESEKLADLCKSFTPLEDLFQDAASGSTVALFVPSWFKASYLNDILVGSLVDIEYLLTEAGALVDFTPRELSKLVRALFADTPKRTQLLEKIDWQAAYA